VPIILKDSIRAHQKFTERGNPMSQKILIPLAVLGLVLSMTACGSLVKESVVPVKDVRVTPEQSDPGRTMVVLPFADYSRGQTPDDYFRRQVKLQEALSYHLARHGYLTPVREDVTQHLMDEGVIRVHENAARYRNRAFMDELGGGWSEDMLAEVRAVVAASTLDSSPTVEVQDVGLDRNRIREISRTFGAAYLLRGRIVEYEMRTEHTLNPFRRGVLPFFFDSASQLVFGVADSETYDLLGDLAIGGGLGALLGSEASHPFTSPSKERVPSGHPLFGGTTIKESGGYDDYHTYNALFWGSIGAGAAYLAKHGGRTPQAVVQVSMALQDGRSGKVLWTNRAEVAVAPVSAWADQLPRSLMDRAVEVAAERLTQELAAGLAGYQVAGMSDMVAPAAPRGATVGPAEVEVPEAAPGPEDEPGAGRRTPAAEPMMWGS